MVHLKVWMWGPLITGTNKYPLTIEDTCEIQLHGDMSKLVELLNTIHTETALGKQKTMNINNTLQI